MQPVNDCKRDMNSGKNPQLYMKKGTFGEFLNVLFRIGFVLQLSFPTLTMMLRKYGHFVTEGN